MKFALIAWTAGIFTLLPCCERRDPTAKLLDEFEAGWTVSPSYEVDVATFPDIPRQKISDDTRTDLGGFSVWFNNLIDDSRGTVMSYSEWNRILTSSRLSVEDRAAKVAMLGGSGSIHPFQYEEGNRGFLVIDTRIPQTWVEVWDREGVRRIRIDFEDPRPTINDVSELLNKLAVLEWPTKTAEQGGTGQPANRPEFKPEGSAKPQPESEWRSR